MRKTFCQSKDLVDGPIHAKKNEGAVICPEFKIIAK